MTADRFLCFSPPAFLPLPSSLYHSVLYEPLSPTFLSRACLCARPHAPACLSPPWRACVLPASLYSFLTFLALRILSSLLFLNGFTVQKGPESSEPGSKRHLVLTLLFFTSSSPISSLISPHPFSQLQNEGLTPARCPAA